ncbi:hypothetical protein [Thalassotalea eurytherma]|uniref:Zinc ribbon domain-containing protein n=1 Tax=Thalassotalea eurytherma TaxID=1144278 RepID=A0ABQ6GY65_9GAMM|nr:hypothetical protein [Thalassotalea eurytherma]GLX80883.1 hypothetical protein theurythT_03350 [Thalassotalea eurytherma]
MANETIGTITCPFCNDEAEVRKDKKNKLYYVGAAGMVKPNMPSGQDYMQKHTAFFNDKLPGNKTDKPNEEKQPKKGLFATIFTDEE